MRYTFQTAAAATGNGNALAIPSGAQSLGIQVTGTFVGTVTFEASVDGTNYVAHEAIPLAGGSGVTTATAAGAYTIALDGIATVRARVSAYTSGAITVIGKLTY